MIKDYSFSVLNLDLTIARNLSEHACGLMNTLYVKQIDDAGTNLRLRFDSSSAPEIELVQGDTFNFRKIAEGDPIFYKKVYISNNAVGSGVAKIIFAHNVFIEKLLRITADMIETGILQQAINIGAVATAIPTTTLLERINIIMKNNGANTIYIGSSTVTTVNGFPLAVGESLSFIISQGVVVYGIVAVGNEELRIIEGS